MDSIHAAILTDNGFTSGTIAEKFIQCRTRENASYLLIKTKKDFKMT